MMIVDHYRVVFLHFSRNVEKKSIRRPGVESLKSQFEVV